MPPEGWFVHPMKLDNVSMLVAPDISTKSIFVRLVDEGTDVWRPVEALAIGECLHVILEQRYDRTDEHWEFPPGAVVRTETQSKSGRSVPVAVERIGLPIAV